MPDHHLLNGLFSHGGREKYPPAALNWVLAVPNLIHTLYIYLFLHGNVEGLDWKTQMYAYFHIVNIYSMQQSGQYYFENKENGITSLVKFCMENMSHM